MSDVFVQGVCSDPSKDTARLAAHYANHGERHLVCVGGPDSMILFLEYLCLPPQN